MKGLNYKNPEKQFRQKLEYNIIMFRAPKKIAAIWALSLSSFSRSSSSSSSFPSPFGSAPSSHPITRIRQDVHVVRMASGHPNRTRELLHCLLGSDNLHQNRNPPPSCRHPNPNRDVELLSGISTAKPLLSPPNSVSNLILFDKFENQHKIRLGKYARGSDSILREGENLQAIWSPDTKTIAVLVSSISYLFGV